MKSLNRKLIATTGLFLALVGLTSFNPFSQANHLVALEKEESITLASSPLVSRSASEGSGDSRNSGKSNNIETKLQADIKRLQEASPASKDDAKPVQSQTTTAGAGVLDDIINDGKKTKEKKSEVKILEKSEKVEAGTPCADGKCEDTEKKAPSSNITEILKKLSPEEQDVILSLKKLEGKTAETAVVESTNKCDGDGSSSYKDYSSRLKCFLTTEKDLKKKHENYGLLAEEMDAFITEVALDEELKDRHITQILSKLSKSKIVRADRELGLKDSIRVAISYNDAQNKKVAFEKNLERAADEISRIDDQLRQVEQYNNGMNPQMNYQANMLQIQRKNAVYNLEKEVAGFQQAYRMSLPSVKNDESTLVSTLRDSMSSEYADIISPIAPVLSDVRLTSLDTTSFSIPNNSSGQNSQSGVYDSRNNGGPQLSQSRPTYDQNDPNMANADISRLSRMSPAEQVQQMQSQIRNGTFNSNGNNTFNSGNNFRGQQFQQNGRS